MSLGLLEPEGFGPPASPADLAALDRGAGPLPPGLGTFLLRSDGYNGTVGGGGGYLQLWPARTILAHRDGYEGAADVPGLLLIGSNAGPTAYGVLRGSFVSVPFLPMLPEEVRALGGSFDAFLQALGRGEGW